MTPSPTPVVGEPPAGWYSDPDGSGGQRYWDAESWTKHCRSADPAAADGVRRSWSRLPMALRITLPVGLVLILVGIGSILWQTTPHDDWARLPKRLNCQLQPGTMPPASITIASVEVNHPRSGVLELVIRFTQPLPQSPTGSHAAGFVGYILTYNVANNGTKFVELGPEEGTDDLAIASTLVGNGGAVSMRPDRDTIARRTAPDTLQILLELKRLGIESQEVSPELTVESQFNTPSTTTVEFATQVCRS